MSNVLNNVNPSEGVEVVPFETTTISNVVGQDVESNSDDTFEKDASSSFDVDPSPSSKNKKNRLFSLSKNVVTGLGFLLVIGAAAVAGASMSAANNSNIQAQQSATAAVQQETAQAGKAGKSQCDSAAVEGVWYGEGRAMNTAVLYGLGGTTDLKATMCMEPIGDDGVYVYVCNQSCETGYSSSAEMYGMIGSDLLQEDECVMDVVETDGAGTYKFRVDTDKDPSISYVLTQPADAYDGGLGQGPYPDGNARRLEPVSVNPAAVARNTLHPLEEPPLPGPGRNLENCDPSTSCGCFWCPNLCEN